MISKRTVKEELKKVQKIQSKTATSEVIQVER